MKKHPKDVTIADLGTLATKDLLAVYNHHAPEPIARFADHPSGFRRTKALLEALSPKAAHPTTTAPKPVATTKTPKTPKPASEPKVRSKVLVARVGAANDLTEYHSVLAAFKALKLPLEKHQRFRRRVKLEGKATFDKFIFTSTKK